MQNNLQSDLKPQSVKLSGFLVREAEERAKHFHRSKAGQIEFWARIGKIAEENPDISFDVIRQILISKEEIQNKETIPFEFSSEKVKLAKSAVKSSANKIIRKNIKKTQTKSKT